MVFKSLFFSYSEGNLLFQLCAVELLTLLIILIFNFFLLLFLFLFFKTGIRGKKFNCGMLSKGCGSFGFYKWWFDWYIFCWEWKGLQIIELWFIDLLFLIKKSGMPCGHSTLTYFKNKKSPITTISKKNAQSWIKNHHRSYLIQNQI